MLNSFRHRPPKVITDIDSRDPVFQCCLLEAGVSAVYRPRVAAPASSRQRGAASPESEIPAVKNVFQHFGGRPARHAMPRIVIRDRRSSRERIPGRVANRIVVAVGVPFTNSRHRAPKVVPIFRLPGSNVAVCQSKVQQREQTGVLPKIEALGGGRVPGNSISANYGRFQPEERNLCLIRGSRAGRDNSISTQRLYFVVVFRVPSAVDWVGCVGPELGARI